MPDTATIISNVQGLATAIGNALRTTNGNVTTNATAISTLRSDMATAIATAIADVKSEILGNADETYDTLKEIQDILTSNQEVDSALNALKCVQYGRAQNLTTTQKTTARTNIDAADANDVVTLSQQTLSAEQKAQVLSNLGAAAASDVTGLGDGVVRHDQSQSLQDANKAQARTNIGAASAADMTALTTRVTTAEGDIDALETLIGDGSNIDFVSTFNTALNGSGNGGE